VAASPPQTSYSLSISVSGSGTVTKNPNLSLYCSGTVVTLTPTPSSGYSFSHWSGALSDSENPKNLTMNSNKSVTAHFQPRWLLSLSVDGIPNPGPIGNYFSPSIQPNNHANQSEYNAGTWYYEGNPDLSLTAIPPSGYGFSHCEVVFGSSVSEFTSNPFTFQMAWEYQMTVVFVPLLGVTTATTGNGNGSIVLDPPGGAYLPGTNLTVTAVPGTGSQFTGWSSALSGMENPTTLLVDGTKHIVAQFTPLSTLNSHTFGDGSVTFNPPGGEYQTGSIVSLTATPSSDWLFQKWIGPVSDPNSQESTIKIGQDGGMVAAVFVNRPGVVGLNLVSDFAYLLSEAGELESVTTFDRNGFTLHTYSEPLYVENGIPDAAELYLLEYILKNPTIDHSRRSGIAHDYAWKVWEQNLDSVTSDLPPGTDPRITRATAGLISLGHFASVKLASELAAEATGVMLNANEKEDPTNPASPYRYEQNAGSFLSADGDADNDGLTNREEWNAASPVASLDNLETYALYATNGNDVPEEPDIDLSRFSCENSLCVGRQEIRVSDIQYPMEGLMPSNPHVFVNGDVILPGENMVGARLGHMLRTIAVPGPDAKFGRWHAPGTLLDGSRQFSEEIIHSKTTMQLQYLPIYAESYKSWIIIPASSSLWDIDIETSDNVNIIINSAGTMRTLTGPAGSYARMRASYKLPTNQHVLWVGKSSSGSADPRYTLTDTAQIEFTDFMTNGINYGYVAPQLITSQIERVNVIVNSTQGGRAFAGSNDYSPGFMDYVTISVGGTVKLRAHKYDGGRFVKWSHDDSTLTVLDVTLDNNDFTTTAIFERNKETQLNASIKTDQGNGSPLCSGYLEFQNAKRYYDGDMDNGTNPLTDIPYERGEKVVVIPRPNSGYTFVGWRLDGKEVPPDTEVGLLSSPNQLTVYMNKDKELIAMFSNNHLEFSQPEVLPNLRPQDLTYLGTGAQNQTVTIKIPLPDGSSVQDVAMSDMYIEDTGGHYDHNPSRPDGGQFGQVLLEDCMARVVYTPGEFSGRYMITAEVGTEHVYEREIIVRVPGLMELPDSDTYGKIGDDEWHPSNHWLMPDAQAILEYVAEKYSSTYHEHSEYEKMEYNDCSLEWGGRFDIRGLWSAGSHVSHRVGRQVDFRIKETPAAMLDVLLPLFRGITGVTVDIKDDPPHWHINILPGSVPPGD